MYMYMHMHMYSELRDSPLSNALSSIPHLSELIWRTENGELKIQNGETTIGVISTPEIFDSYHSLSYC